MVQQADLIGFGSLPIVLAACFFTGAALALNSASTLDRFGAMTVIGQLVSVGIVRELGPVLAGLVVAGRNASGMASELGSMIVTEQINSRRSARLGRWRFCCASGAAAGYAPVLEQYLADTRILRCFYRPDQAGRLRIHRRHHWLLLRFDD